MIKLFAILFLYAPLTAGLCRYHIKQVEKELGIPQDTLAAIGQVESGKYSPYHKHKEAWPWTVYAKGKGRFFQTKTQAQRYIEKLLDEGEVNIDIGCMQVNWHYHHKNFKSTSDMLHPRENVRYAGNLLKKHYKAVKNWDSAVGNYHSKTPEHHNKYRHRIKLAQNDLQNYKKVRPKHVPRFKRWRPVRKPAEQKFFALEKQERAQNIKWLR